MQVLVVHAHPEPTSFNRALTDTAVDTLTGAGHAVTVSDLYAEGFEPVLARHDFTTVRDPAVFRVQAEQQHAHDHGGFAPDLAREMDRLVRADLLILQFPLWWFGMPAILKGWIDRVFAFGFAYGGPRWYDQGPFRGKRAMVSVTTGGPAHFFSPTGISGHIDALLYPIQHGCLFFTGMAVLPPFVSWGPGRASAEQRAADLAAWRERLLAVEHTEPIPFPRLADYDERFQLRARPPA